MRDPMTVAACVFYAPMKNGGEIRELRSKSCRSWRIPEALHYVSSQEMPSCERASSRWFESSDLASR